MVNKQQVVVLSTLGMIILFSLLALVGLLAETPFALLMLIIALLGGFMWLRSYQSDDMPNLEQRKASAYHLQAAREREQAFYDLANTISSTLDYNRVLEVALDIGSIATRHGASYNRMVAAAFVFQGKARKLHVLAARGLTPTDTTRVVDGRAGVLGLALQQRKVDPVFDSQPQHDPELQYFSAFQDCRSIMVLPLLANFEHFGVLVFGADQENAFSRETLELLKAIGTLATIALQKAVLYQSILQEKDRIVEVEEDARKQLARNLHDGPTQSISVIAMRVGHLRKSLERQNAQAFEDLGKIEELAQRTTKEIRHMLFTLRPLILETQGLTAALQQLAEKMQETFATRVNIEVQPQIERWLDAHGQGVVFYIIEEAVNNARKHARSENIWVRLRKQDETIVVEVQDDGVGFDHAAVMSDYTERGSLGMINMRERAELVEGVLHLDSAVGKGTKITILVPVRAGSLSLQADSLAENAIQPTVALPAVQGRRGTARLPGTEKPSIPFSSKQSPST